MARGSKPGEHRGGRQKGTPNKRTQSRELAIVEASRKIEAAVGEGAFKGDAHALLVAVYKDPSHEWELRLDAAKAAVAYEKPRLASSVLEVKNPLADLSTDAIARLVQAAQAEDERSGGDDAIH